ncbi:efflux transporter periplasmic adaptor subunit [Stenotrophomonas sp. ZAC14D1_NAIMI4_6]|uniref:efflux RND transporter periplasmic adaptor subunit n=1 Tax=unclassified Stenotrophomonas maltophilia group TaxID=2961925 RepID=UPI000D53F1F2|nr:MULTISPECIES: efflux RND transporter periplasmic adaptor subunit [unclassified Stenotrophomonas maltophilia group]AWH38593.1 efflux transporter periplasmic adaptor subunit [Stenotrophomonas sp. ZAC14D1_NAIMI4_6]AWH42724.1 efflux transporter periplasmic adaptor subunit [Stenotrophomonas sp. ZAC14D1_NAIMI4_1]
MFGFVAWHLPGAARGIAHCCPPARMSGGTHRHPRVPPMQFLPKRFTALALVTLLAACAPSAPDEATTLPSVHVHTLQPEDAALHVVLPGRAVAAQQAEVRPQVDGIVARRLFEEGSQVRAGQPLYQLDDITLRAGRDEAKARLNHAYATCSAAREEARRLAQLADSRLVSLQDKDRSAAAYQRAEADIQMAMASLQTAKVALDHARIAAPISGRIGRSNVTEGALVTSHQPEALTTVRGLDPMYVDLSQSAAEWLQLRRDIADGRLTDNRQLPVAIQLEDGSRLQQSGTLQFSDVSVDPGTGTYALRVRVANPDGVLLPGMYVSASIGAGVRREALLVPMQAVSRDATGRTHVMVVDGEGTVANRAVQLGRALGERWLVEDGLRAGERVVVQGQHKLQPGSRISPVEASAPVQGAEG